MGLEYVTENIIYESKLSKSYQDIWIGHLSLKLTQSNWIAYVKILLPYPLNNRHELKLAKLILYPYWNVWNHIIKRIWFMDLRLYQIMLSKIKS